MHQLGFPYNFVKDKIRGMTTGNVALFMQTTIGASARRAAVPGAW